MKKVLLSFCLAVASYLAVNVQSSSAAVIHALGDQNPNSFPFSTNNITDATRGWHFHVNGANLQVNQLGIFSPTSNASPVTLTLFDFSTQAILAQTVTSPAAGWIFNTLSSPVALTQGSDYIVTMNTGANGRYFYGHRSSIGNTWFPTGDIQYVDMRFANNVGPSVFPTDVLTDYQYGIPDIGYSVASVATPEPSSLLIFGGLAGLMATRLRRKKAA